MAKPDAEDKKELEELTKQVERAAEKRRTKLPLESLNSREARALLRHIDNLTIEARKGSPVLTGETEKREVDQADLNSAITKLIGIMAAPGPKSPSTNQSERAGSPE